MFDQAILSDGRKVVQETEGNRSKCGSVKKKGNRRGVLGLMAAPTASRGTLIE